MNRTWSMVILIVIAAAAVSCAQPETEEPPAEGAPVAQEPGAGPDPTVVDASHYKTEFENERVRVVRVSYGPGEESVMHHHPESVAVFLTDYHTEFGKPDGTSEETHGEAGQHGFSPAEQHLPKNIGEGPLELVIVELKSSGPAAEGETGADSTVVDPDHYQVEFENERVRVLRISYGPGEESVLHYHPDSVAVFLTEHHVEFGRPDGTSEEVLVEAGQHLFSPAEQHLPKSLGEEPMELVLVELK